MMLLKPVFLSVIASSLVSASLSARDNPHGPNKTWSPPNLPPHPAGKYWPGFKGINNIFAFGDSYTTTGFDPRNAQPNTSNPLGNPISPTSPFGYTAVNGPGWLQSLTTKYNSSRVLTYNLAYGGATIDSDLIAPYKPTVLSFRQQVNQEFFPYYVESTANSKWTTGNTIFAIFIGINDVGNAWYASNATAIFDAVFTMYAGLLDELYHANARNFLLLNVPPVNRSPSTTSSGAYSIAFEGAAIEDFNDRIARLAYSLQYTYADTTVVQFDTHRVFNLILDYPQAFPQTSGIKNTTQYCTAYENGTPARNTLDPSCGVPVDEYFWLNGLHPVYIVQDVMAQLIAEQLTAVPVQK